jgi:hypothetical protein
MMGSVAAVVSLKSPTYGRLWLSGTHHPGDTVSCTQAENMVLAAEARTGPRPKRRTDLLRQRINPFEQQVAEKKKRQEVQAQTLQLAKEDLATAEQQQQERQTQLAALEKDYQERARKERPTSRLTLTRQRAQAAAKRLHSRQLTWKEAQNRLEKTNAHYQQQFTQLNTLYLRLKPFEQENATNPIRCKPTFAWMLALAPMITWRCWSNSGARSIPNRTATMS